MSTIDDIKALPARMEALEQRVDLLQRIVRTVYLPMDCPNCGRHRLEYNGVHVTCEKCGCQDWEHPSRADNVVDAGRITSKPMIPGGA